MMDAGPTLGEELRHRAVRIAGLQELDLHVAQRQADDGRTVGRLGAPRLEAEHVAIEAEGGVDGRNGNADVRSEEHTSELQSLAYLVCRLLLEKKKERARDRLVPIRALRNGRTTCTLSTQRSSDS